LEAAAAAAVGDFAAADVAVAPGVEPIADGGVVARVAVGGGVVVAPEVELIAADVDGGVVALAAVGDAAVAQLVAVDDACGVQQQGVISFSSFPAKGEARLSQLRHVQAGEVQSIFWQRCYKTFYGRNLQFIVISYNVCPRQALPV